MNKIIGLVLMSSCSLFASADDSVFSIRLEASNTDYDSSALSDTSETGQARSSDIKNQILIGAGYETGAFLWDMSFRIEDTHVGFTENATHDVQATRWGVDTNVSIARYKILDTGLTISPTIGAMFVQNDFNCAECDSVYIETENGLNEYYVKKQTSKSFNITAGVQADYDYDLGPIRGRLNLDAAYGVMSGSSGKYSISNDFIISQGSGSSMFVSVGYRYQTSEQGYKDSADVERDHTATEKGIFWSLTAQF